jgi:hypothetical protein
MTYLQFKKKEGGGVDKIEFADFRSESANPKPTASTR